MFISDVTALVGLTAKSIRYYEENGLLTPTRNKNNAYRIYTEEEIEKLKRIKFLRELGVSIKELKDLENKKITLNDCMKERIKKIDEEKDKFNKAKEMCIEISESNNTYENFEIIKYFEKINKLNKEGFTMREIKTSKRKKIIGAVLSSLIFSIFFIFLISIISYFQFRSNNIPWLIYIFLITILTFPVISIIYNLIIRIKEINKGEEDEASKY